MASSKEYLHFILEQLSALEDISYRSMMGEYILYYRGKIEEASLFAVCFLLFPSHVPSHRLSAGSIFGDMGEVL